MMRPSGSSVRSLAIGSAELGFIEKEGVEVILMLRDAEAFVESHDAKTKSMLSE